MRSRKEEKNIEKGIFFMILSALCISLFSLCMKVGTKVSSISLLLFLRFFIPFLLIIPFLLWKKAPFPRRSIKAILSLHMPRALSTCIAQYSLAYYISKSSLLNATMLYNSGPIFIPILDSLLYGHKIEKSTWYGMGIAVCGVACILKPDSGIFNLLSLYGLLSGLGMAVSQVLYGKNAKKERNDENFFYLYFLTSLLTLFPLLAKVFYAPEGVMCDLQNLLHSESAFVFSIVGAGLVSIGNQGFRGVAYACAPPGFLSSFMYFAILFSGILDGMIYHRFPDLLSLLGMGLILGGTFGKWVYRKGKRAFTGTPLDGG